MPTWIGTRKGSGSAAVTHPVTGPIELDRPKTDSKSKTAAGHRTLIVRRDLDMRRKSWLRCVRSVQFVTVANQERMLRGYCATSASDCDCGTGWGCSASHFIQKSAG